MITVEGLRAYGANVDEGLSRCMNMEEFYLRLVEKALKDRAFDELKTAVDDNDLDAAFEAAHRLKGAVGNLSLTPLYEVIEEMVELLRNRKEADYTVYLDKLETAKKLLEDMV